MRFPHLPRPRPHRAADLPRRMRTPRGRPLVILAALAVAASAAPAQAASIVFIRGANVWVARADGSGAHPITSDGNAGAPYMSPSEDDHGRIVAQRGVRFVRLDQAGRRLGTVPSVLVGKPGTVTGFGPFSPRVSPDGALIAYYVGFLSGTFDPACRCTVGTDEEDVVYARSDGSGPLGTSRFWRSPSFADGRHVIVAAPDNRQTAQIGIADVTQLGDGRQTAGWFSDDAAGGLMLNLDEPDLARTLDRLAAVRGQAQEQLALYAVHGDGSVSLRCLMQAPRGAISRPSFAPDGATLMWADARGIWQARLPAGWEDDCSLVAPHLVAAGAADGGWGARSLPRDTRPPRIRTLALGVRPRRSALAITVATDERATLSVLVQRLVGGRARTVATLRGRAGSAWTLTWRHAVSRGTYRAVATATDAAGNRSRAVRSVVVR